VASPNGAGASPGKQLFSALPKPTLPEITPDMAPGFAVSVVITEADNRDPQPSSEDNTRKDAIEKKQPKTDYYTMPGIQEWLDFSSANQTNSNLLQPIITFMLAYFIQTVHY